MTKADKIKVMLVTPTLQCGGAERFVSLFCNHLYHPDIQLTLVVINNADPFYKIDNPSVKLFNLDTSRVSKSLFKLKQLIEKEKPDIVFTTANHLNLLVAIFRFLFPKKITWMARETSVVSVNSKYSRYPALYNVLLKTFYSKLDHIVCQSSFMQKDLHENYSVPLHKTSVIYNAVDPALKYYEGPVKQHAFITVARLSVEKGIDTLLTTLASLKIPFRYQVIGEGPERNKLEALAVSLGIKDKVSFSGEVAEPFAGREDNQIYLMGSLYEGFPNAVIEANAVGMPVVAKNVPGGIADLITDSTNGFLASNDADFRNKILIATTFPFNRKQISLNALERFSIKKMTSSFIKKFFELSAIKKK